MKNLKTHIKTILKVIWSHKSIAAGLILLGAILLWGPTIYANLSTRHERYDANKVALAHIPYHPVAIVFGAGVTSSGQPTPYLRWRVDTAVRLYKAHRVSKLLMTADNSRTYYDEPAAMQKLAEQEGVPARDIVLDYAGFNTYDSCYRARAIFKVTSATLVSQGYHLPRAVMACNDLGIHSIGVAASHPDGRDWAVKYIMREWISTDKIVIQLMFKPHSTLLGKPEPIAS